MKKTFLFLLLVACFAAKGQTIHVNGEQTGVWEADTVRVVGDVTVIDSVVVLPGTVVLFDGFYAIDVKKGASFAAQGTVTDSIFFTVADTTGFYIYNDGVGGWNGFYVEKASRFLLDYCVLEYGKAADTLDRFGGALNIRLTQDVVINHSTLRCNFSREQGGALYGYESRVTCMDCKFNENKVYTGDNTYAMYGGAAQFLKCDVVMTGMEFHANYADHCIGGALSLDSCAVMLDRATFTDNVGINGGGLYLMRSNHKECTLSNLLFDNNLSGHFGGGFALSNASPKVSNVLVINNTSIGVSCCGVFFFEESAPRMTNCIIYGNYPEYDTLSPLIDTTEMWVWTFEGSAPEFHNCLIEGGMKYIHSWENITVFENVIDADPMFVDAENHDFRLAMGSPCIDAGDPNTPSYVLEGFDLSGNPRVANQRIDIGPYEYSGAFVHQHLSSASNARLVGNPLGVHSRIELDAAWTGEVELTVYSMAGRCVARKAKRVDGIHSLTIGDLVDRLVPGVYLIEVKGNQGSCTLKAVR